MLTATGVARALLCSLPVLVVVACGRLAPPEWDCGDAQSCGADGILAAAEARLIEVDRYRVEETRDLPAGYVAHTDFVLSARAMKTRIRAGEEADEVVLYWIGEVAYGRADRPGRWFRVSVPGQPVSTLHGVFALVGSSDVVAVEQQDLGEEPCWVLTARPELDLEVAESFYGWLEEGSDEERRIAARVTERLKQIEIENRLWISRESGRVLQASTSTSAAGERTAIHYRFSAFNSPELSISLPPEALEAEGEPVALGSLFFRLPEVH